MGCRGEGFGDGGFVYRFVGLGRTAERICRIVYAHCLLRIHKLNVPTLHGRSKDLGDAVYESRAHSLKRHTSER